MIWNDQMLSIGHCTSGITKINDTGRVSASKNVQVLMQENTIFREVITSQIGSYLAHLAF